MFVLLKSGTMYVYRWIVQWYCMYGIFSSSQCLASFIYDLKAWINISRLLQWIVLLIYDTWCVYTLCWCCCSCVGHADSRQALLWICDYIKHQSSREQTQHSRDLHTTIVAAFSTIMTWLNAHPYLMGTKVCRGLPTGVQPYLCHFLSIFAGVCSTSSFVYFSQSHLFLHYIICIKVWSISHVIVYSTHQFGTIVMTFIIWYICIFCYLGVSCCRDGGDWARYLWLHLCCKHCTFSCDCVGFPHLSFSLWV